MGLTDNHFDPAFRYESLARESFGNCGKWGDPWGYAAQDFFSEFVKVPVSERGKKALRTILTPLILKFKDSEIKDSLLDLDTSIDSISTQSEAIALIDSTIALIRSQD